MSYRVFCSSAQENPFFQEFQSIFQKFDLAGQGEAGEEGEARWRAALPSKTGIIPRRSAALLAPLSERCRRHGLRKQEGDKEGVKAEEGAEKAEGADDDKEEDAEALSKRKKKLLRRMKARPLAPRTSKSSPAASAGERTPLLSLPPHTPLWRRRWRSSSRSAAAPRWWRSGTPPPRTRASSSSSRRTATPSPCPATGRRSASSCRRERAPSLAAGARVRVCCLRGACQTAVGRGGRSLRLQQPALSVGGLPG